MILYPFYNKLKKSYIKPMNNKTNIVYYLYYLLFIAGAMITKREYKQ